MKEKNWLHYMGVFLISPFVSFSVALMHPNDKFSYNIIWFFTIFFGLTFAIDYEASYDLVRYLEEFNSWKGEGKDLNYLIQNSYGVERNSHTDIFFPLISLISARLYLSNILFLGFLGLIFGYFYSRIYKNLMDNISLFKIDFFLIILISTFMLINPIWRGINGIRFSLAAIIFVYIILNNYKKGFTLVNLLKISSLFLIHFSMLFPIVIFFIFHFMHRVLKIEILFFTFLISFFMTSINLGELNYMIRDFLPDFLHARSDAYLRDSYLTEISEKHAETNLYALIFLKSLFYATSLMIFFIFKNFKNLITYDPKLIYIIKFSFLFAAIVNMLSFIPSFSRMGLISNTLILYIFMVMITNITINKNYLMLSKILITPLLVLYVIVQMRIGFDHMSIETILGNPLMALFDLDNTPLIDLIK